MLKKQIILSLLICISICNLFAQRNKAINITADIASKAEPVKNIWAYFGYDEPNYTYMKDGKKLLTEIASFSKVPVYVRTHNLLTTGDGTAALKWGSTNAYTEDSLGKPVYDWHIADSIFDTYVKLGMKPIAEIGFMPEALSTHPQPYRHYWKPGLPYEQVYTGWAYPPKDYSKWGELVYQWVKHCVQRYGEQEVNSWWWEVWNEPNIGYWKGTPEEYFKLYDYAADAVKRACPKARVGGPTSTGPSWDKAEKFLQDFLNHCAEGINNVTGSKGAPLDYISFHAKGSPKFIDGHVRMNMVPELTDIVKGCKTVMASAFKNLPLIIGECDPEGCAACGMATNPENAYRNGTMYSSYTAASFARIHDIAKQTGANIEGAVSWSFEFEDQPWFYGFRDLATNGIDKPVLNVFRMYALMKGDRIATGNPAAIPSDSIIKNSVRGKNRDIGSFAVSDSASAAIMLWNYHDDDLPVLPEEINLVFKNLPANKITAALYRIDSTHSNSYEKWKAMGKPQQLSETQYQQLEVAGQLHMETLAESKKIRNGVYTTSFLLPGQGVYLVRLQYLQ
jgi:xylan 1,4-beta-xylosidase